MLETIWGKLCGPYGVCSENASIRNSQVVGGLLFLWFGGLVALCFVGGGAFVCTVTIMRCSRDICTFDNLYFDEDTLVCTLLSVH